MADNLGHKLTHRFQDEIRFFKGWVDKPAAVGAILPTSGATARRMASVIDPGSGLPVLELGPGTGVITKAILQRGVAPENLTAIEYSSDFLDHLRACFAGVRFIHGDAMALDRTLPADAPRLFDSVISAVPLLQLPMARRVSVVEGWLSRLPRGRPVVQITYSALPLIGASDAPFQVEPLDWIMWNLPPARLWIYRHGAES